MIFNILLVLLVTCFVANPSNLLAKTNDVVIENAAQAEDDAQEPDTVLGMPDEETPEDDDDDDVIGEEEAVSYDASAGERSFSFDADDEEED
jgi:hypothetical protein